MTQLPKIQKKRKESPKKDESPTKRAKMDQSGSAEPSKSSSSGVNSSLLEKLSAVTIPGKSVMSARGDIA